MSKLWRVALDRAKPILHYRRFNLFFRERLSRSDVAVYRIIEIFSQKYGPKDLCAVVVSRQALWNNWGAKRRTFCSTWILRVSFSCRRMLILRYRRWAIDWSVLYFDVCACNYTTNYVHVICLKLIVLLLYIAHWGDSGCQLHCNISSSILLKVKST